MDFAIVWAGDSKEVLSSFPAEVKGDLGFGLRRLQEGKTPACGWRPMPSIGPGVWELKTEDEQGWYRVIYLSVVDNVINVLHSFKKQSKKTPRAELRTAKDRLKAVKQRSVEMKKWRKK